MTHLEDFPHVMPPAPVEYDEFAGDPAEEDYDDDPSHGDGWTSDNGGDDLDDSDDGDGDGDGDGDYDDDDDGEDYDPHENGQCDDSFCACWL